ncbi:hypothetical protein FE257_011044 [Aspergillus nanangensis]|uniref:Zinc finger PHD-type domain-containing protein n=1 Tax=Aspergillus nanangensis TaxID=2582783 RepID=A0AAD4GRQ3_ASPNN|nr:hypothetical protein FE257_011044 [Aspergillus nanangensis]
MTTTMNQIEASSPIYNSARLCSKFFEQRLTRAEIPAGDSLLLEELRGRFNLWAKYVGVFATPRASLDARLASYSEIKDMVVELLDMVQRNLQWDDDLETDDETDSALGSQNDDKNLPPLVSPGLKLMLIKMLNRMSASLESAESLFAFSRIAIRDPFVCPLCDCVPESLVPYVNEKPFKQISEHIAQHLKSLALLSLSYVPSNLDDTLSVTDVSSGSRISVDTGNLGSFQQYQDTQSLHNSEIIGEDTEVLQTGKGTNELPVSSDSETCLPVEMIHYYGYKFFQSQVQPGQMPTWKNAEKIRMLGSQADLYNMVNKRPKRNNAAEDYSNLSRIKQIHIKELIKELEHHAPRYEWTLIYIKEEDRPAIGKGYRHGNYETMDVVLMRKPAVSFAFENPQLGQGYSQRIDPVQNWNSNLENRKIRCICGLDFNLPMETPLIRCTDCQFWQHSDCVGFETAQKNQPGDYFCEQCRPTVDGRIFDKKVVTDDQEADEDEPRRWNNEIEITITSFNEIDQEASSPVIATLDTGSEFNFMSYRLWMEMTDGRSILYPSPEDQLGSLAIFGAGEPISSMGTARDVQWKFANGAKAFRSDFILVNLLNYKVILGKEEILKNSILSGGVSTPWAEHSVRRISRRVSIELESQSSRDPPGRLYPQLSPLSLPPLSLKRTTFRGRDMREFLQVEERTSIIERTENDKDAEKGPKKSVWRRIFNRNSSK